MDSAPTSEALVRPWRRATLVAAAVAAGELVLLIAVGLILLGKPLLHSARASVQRKAAAPSKQQHLAPAAVTRKVPLGPPKLVRAKTSILILNGNGISGAAAAEAQKVKGKGYRTVAAGNAPSADYPRDLVMFRPRYRAEGARLGRDLGIRIVTPLDGMRVRDLHGAQLVIILGH